jgi:hypothetical protein
MPKMPKVPKMPKFYGVASLRLFYKSLTLAV